MNDRMLYEINLALDRYAVEVGAIEPADVGREMLTPEEVINAFCICRYLHGLNFHKYLFLSENITPPHFSFFFKCLGRDLNDLGVTSLQPGDKILVISNEVTNALIERARSIPASCQVSLLLDRLSTKRSLPIDVNRIYVAVEGVNLYQDFSVMEKECCEFFSALVGVDAPFDADETPTTVEKPAVKHASIGSVLKTFFNLVREMSREDVPSRIKYISNTALLAQFYKPGYSSSILTKPCLFLPLAFYLIDKLQNYGNDDRVLLVSNHHPAELGAHALLRTMSFDLLARSTNGTCIPSDWPQLTRHCSAAYELNIDISEKTFINSDDLFEAAKTRRLVIYIDSTGQFERNHGCDSMCSSLPELVGITEKLQLSVIYIASHIPSYITGGLVTEGCLKETNCQDILQLSILKHGDIALRLQHGMVLEDDN